MGDGRASMTDAGTELMDGLVLYEHALSEQTQREILAFVEEQLSDGRAGSSTGKTYSAPPDTWLKTGQGREMLQYGAYTKCNKVQPTAVPPLPPILEALLDALQAAGVIRGAEERPDTCVVNVYAPGSWLPPHVDSEAFDRPFWTASLVSAQEAVFGEAIAGERGEWQGPLRFRMGVGSVLRVSGEAAGPTCRHALPRATHARVSLTFRKLGRATRERFEAIRAASDEAARARADRRRQAKLARGRVLRPGADRPPPVDVPVGCAGTAGEAGAVEDDALEEFEEVGEEAGGPRPVVAKPKEVTCVRQGMT